MATQNLTTADAILKDLYVGPIVEQLNQKTYMIDQIERDSDHIDHTGRRAVIPVHKNRNRGRTSLADGGTLPVAGRQDWADAIVNIKYHYYGIEISDQAIEATKRNEGAFVALLDAETKGVAKDMRKDINRQVFGTGDGILTACVSAAAGVVTVDTVQYIGIGDTLDILVSATGATSAGVVGTTVTARDPVAKTITVSPAPGTPASINSTYAVYVTGARNNEMDGIQNIISTSRTLHSINSATAGNEYWNAASRDVGTNDTTTAVAGESVFEQLADDVGATGNGEIEVFLTTRGIRRRLADTYQSQKRFNDAQAVNVHGGYSAIMVNEVPVVADDDAPKKRAWGLNKGAFKWFEQTSPGWLESKDGQVFHLKPSSTAGRFDTVWQAWFRWYAALGCVAPQRTGRLRYCTDDNPS